MITTADEMRRALYRKFSPRQAVLFEIATNWHDEGGEGSAWQRTHRRRIDVLLVQKSRRREYGPVDMLAIEIKVTRSDFLADLRNPAKQARWREVAHRHAYAVPSGLVRREEIPAGSGLLTVGDRPEHWYQWPMQWEIRAPRNGGRPDLPAWLIMAFADRASGAEARCRGIAGTDSETDEDVRGALHAARNRVALLTHQLHAAQTQIGEWRTLYAAQGHLPCEFCGKPVRPKSVRGGHFNHWSHVSASDEGPCVALRREHEPRYPPSIRPADDPAAALTGQAS